jgi:hypothetical protein
MANFKQLSENPEFRKGGILDLLQLVNINNAPFLNLLVIIMTALKKFFVECPSERYIFQKFTHLSAKLYTHKLLNRTGPHLQSRRSTHVS